MRKLFDILILVIVFSASVFAVYYSIRLRINSNRMTMKTKQEEDQDIVRIYAEMEQKAQEINPEYRATIEEFKQHQIALEEYQQYIYTNAAQAKIATSNHVTV